MGVIFSRATQMRKFSDLIREVCGDYANIDPDSSIEPGDYGIIDKHTGKFEKHGNIFEDEDTKNLFTPDKAKYVKKGVGLPYREVKTLGVIKRKLSAEPTVGFVGVATGSFEALFKFNADRAAALVMRNAITSTLSAHESVLKPANFKYLKEKVLIWEVVNCTSFYSYLSAQASEELGLTFKLDVPVVTAPGINVGGGISGSWLSKDCAGQEQVGDERPGIKYTALFRAMVMGKRDQDHRDFDSLPMGQGLDEDCWLDMNAPWNKLDDDGNEREDNDDDDDDESSDEEE